MGGQGLLERDRELVTLDHALDRAVGGHGAAVIVEGDPGVGKSSLLAAACERGRARGFRVLTARASALEQGFAFGVARQLLQRAHRGDVTMRPEAPEGEHDAGLSTIVRMFGTLVDLVDADGPVLAAIDDAQWIDDPSARFLVHAALRAAELPIAMLVASRAGEHGPGSELVAQLDGLPGSVRLAPRALSLEAVDELAGEILGDEAGDGVAAACLRATGGNPFYLRELLLAVAADDQPASAARLAELVPPAVLRSVVVRLGRLGGEAAELARAVAVLGDGASLRTAATLANLEPPAAELAADKLARASILDAGEPLRFAHPMIASTLLSDMGHFAAGRAHLRAAELLRAEGAAPERVAAHLDKAPPTGDQEVVSVLEVAAAEAADSGDSAQSRRLLERALAEPPDPARRAHVLLALARAESLSDAPSAPERLEAAIAELDAGVPRADALAELATIHHHRGAFERAADLAARASAELDAGDPGRERMLGIELAARLLSSGPTPEVVAAFAPLVAACRAGDVPTDPGLLSLLAGWTSVEAEPALVRRLAEAATAHDPLIDGSRGASVGWVASALIYTDELELGERWLSEALAAAEQRGEVLAAAIAARNRAVIRYHLGQLEAAIEDAERALEAHREGWTSSPFSTPVLVDACVARGDLAAAARALEIGERTGRDSPDYGLLVEARARLRLAEGNPERALADALSLGEGDQKRFDAARVWGWRELAARAALRVGRREQASALIEPQIRALRTIGPARQLGAALTVAGLLDDAGDGVALLEEAVSTLERSPARLQRCESSLELGAALRRGGERGRAAELLYTALQDAAELGAEPLAARAREELRCLGLRPRRSARTGADSLTPSEQRVADRAAAGLSNPAIAAELHLTRSTVETHLRSTYRKLGIAGRAELPNAFGDRAESSPA